jgi:hypothetical protein
MLPFQERFKTLGLTAMLVVPAAVLVACGDSGGGVAIANAAPIISPRSISISPSTLSARVGSTVSLTATNSGGEAMRFFTDWSIQEGAAGGTLGEPTLSGYVSTVNYTAPAVPGGPYHIIARDRVDPAHFKAIATITVIR